MKDWNTEYGDNEENRQVSAKSIKVIPENCSIVDARNPFK